jgi:UDP-N-acetylglucosamine 2-epimerase
MNDEYEIIFNLSKKNYQESDDKKQYIMKYHKNEEFSKERFDKICELKKLNDYEMVNNFKTMHEYFETNWGIKI